MIHANGRRIKVMHLIKGLGRGGAETVLVDGLRVADRGEFAYSVAYFLSAKTALVQDLESQGIPVVCLESVSTRHMLMAARRVLRLVRDNGIDVLHCHLPVAAAIGRVIGRIAGVPVIYSEQNMHERYHPITRRLNVATWNWQHAVVAVSQEVAASIERHTSSTVPVTVVVNGCDTDRFVRDEQAGMKVRQELAIPSAAPVIGTVAVFRSQKRLDHWIDAARAIHGEFPEARFLIVGDGPLRAEVEGKIDEAGLGKVVDRVGLQSDVRPFLSAMDVFMMSSEFEGLPVALVEAMSMGCVPVCTSVGGIPEVITHGENGLLVRAGSPSSLAEAACSMLSEPARIRVLAREARRRVQEAFSVRQTQRALQEIYRSAANVAKERKACSC